MEQLVKNLNSQAFCFQYYCKEVIDLSIQEMCEYYAKLILETIEADKLFHVIGFSVGGLLMLEVIRILEKNGRKGSVVVLDSSPLIVKQRMSFPTEELMQNEICDVLLRLLWSKTFKEEYIKQIEDADSWEVKKKLLFSMIPVKSVERTGDRILNGMINMIKLINDYENAPVKLKSSCTLIGSTMDAFDVLSKSHELSEYFEYPIQIHQVDVNHFLIPSDPEIAKIILKSWTE